MAATYSQLKRSILGLSCASLVLLLRAAGASACDPCALYSASQLKGHEAGSFSIAVSEQYTEYDESRVTRRRNLRDGESVSGFSTTQFALAYDVSDRFGVQLTVPLISRWYDDVDSYRRDEEYEVGLGDVALLTSASVVDYRSPEWFVLASLFGGLKFPTGDTGKLEAISEEDENPVESRAANFRHHAIGTASGGRALTLGTGSYDIIFGSSLVTRYEQALVLASVQYTLRTEGDFEYEFADDLVWTVGPGAYLRLDDRYTVAARAALSGEFKGKDRQGGDKVEGSQISNLYLGPEVLFSIGSAVSGEVAIDFRVTDEDSDATVVPESRVRASLAYRF